MTLHRPGQRPVVAVGQVSDGPVPSHRDSPPARHDTVLVDEPQVPRREVLTDPLDVGIGYRVVEDELGPASPERLARLGLEIMPFVGNHDLHRADGNGTKARVHPYLPGPVYCGALP